MKTIKYSTFTNLFSAIMMSEFLVFFQTGLHHVLDINGYDHVLFLAALALPYKFKDWKALLLLISIFTLGHTVSLILSAMNWVRIPAEIIEFLIPTTIIITALLRLAKPASVTESKNLPWTTFVTLFFGLIHGFGFSNYFNEILGSEISDKIIPLFGFAIGIEAAQIVVVLALLLLAYFFQVIIKCSRRDFNLATAGIIAGLALPILYETSQSLF